MGLLPDNTATHTPTLREQIAHAIKTCSSLGGKPLPVAPKLSTSTIRAHLGYDWHKGRSIRNAPRTSSVLRELRKMERDGLVQCIGITKDVCPSWRSRGAVDDGELVWCEARAALAKAGAA